MILKLTCQGMWVARSRTIWFADRGCIGSQRLGNCLLRSFFIGIKKTVWHHTLKLLPQLLITPTPQVNQDLPFWIITKRDEGSKAGQDQYQVGDLCHSEGWRDWWEYQWGKNQKDEGKYGWLVLFSTHHFCPRPLSFLVVSAFLLHGLQMMNSCKGLLRKSHTRIDNFFPLIRLSTL